MAISANASILAMLKVYYKKEGIQNLLFRNSPLLKKMNKERVEGKEQRFAADLEMQMILRLFHQL